MKLELNSDELRFFLTGGINLGEVLPDIPCDWLEPNSWGQVQRLDKLPNFRGFSDHFVRNISDYKVMFECQEPEKFVYPEDYDTKLTPLQKLCVLRTIRPEKVIPAIQIYVINAIGENFINPPSFDLQLTYKDSTNQTPLIFVLSPGSDPLTTLRKFADAQKKPLAEVSLG